MKFKQWWAIAQAVLLAIGIILICFVKKPPEASNEVSVTPRPSQQEKQRDGADIMIDHAQEEARKMLWDE